MDSGCEVCNDWQEGTSSDFLSADDYCIARPDEVYCLKQSGEYVYAPDNATSVHMGLMSLAALIMSLQI